MFEAGKNGAGEGCGLRAWQVRAQNRREASQGTNQNKKISDFGQEELLEGKNHLGSFFFVRLH